MATAIKKRIKDPTCDLSEHDENVSVCMEIISPPAVVAIEQTLPIMHNFEEVTFGTLDVGMVFNRASGERTGRVIDWKNGYEPDEDETYKQMRMLAVAFAQRHGLAECEAIAWWHNTGHEVRAEVQSFEEVIDAASVIAAEIEHAKKSPTLFRPGSYCRKCRGAPLCSAAKGSMETISEIEIREDKPLTNEQLTEAVELWKTVVSPLGKALMKLLRQRVQTEPQNFPGWEMKTTRGKRSCKGIEVERVKKLVAGVIDAESFEEFREVSLKVKPLEDAYVKARASEEGVTEKAAREEFHELTDNFCSSPPVPKLERVRVKKGGS